MRLSIAVLVLLGGCSPFCLSAPATDKARPAVAADEDAPLPLIVSVKDLMGGAIAFSAHVIDQVEGTDAPLTAGDWGAARAASADLMAAATLLTTPNNNVIDNMRRRDPEWQALARDMQDAGIDIAAASHKQDRDRLASGVSAMHAACQTCHAKHSVHGQ